MNSPEKILNKRFTSFATLLAAALLLVGCPSQPVKPPEPPPEPISAPRPVAPPVKEVETTGLPDRGLPLEFNDPASPLFQRVIYFDYDNSDILPQFVEVLRAHAMYLSTNPRTGLMLEGHADERGTREYNLALAEQRATTVRRFLLAEGVASGQVETFSFGEERPAQRGHDEESWALNRRVQLIYGGQIR